MMDWNVFCKHYRAAAFNDTCTAGVAYRDVRIAGEPGKVWVYPCFQSNGRPDLCARCEYPSDEEIVAEKAQARQVAIQYFTDLQAHICHECKVPVEAYEQVGRSVYAKPCWHRQWQGKIGSANQAIAEERQRREQR